MSVGEVVGPGFSAPGPRGDVRVDLGIRDGADLDADTIDQEAAVGRGGEDRHPRRDGVRSFAEEADHAGGVRLIAGLPDDDAPLDDHGVRAKDDLVGPGALGDTPGLEIGERGDPVLRRAGGRRKVPVVEIVGAGKHREPGVGQE